MQNYFAVMIIICTWPLKRVALFGACYRQQIGIKLKWIGLCFIFVQNIYFMGTAFWFPGSSTVDDESFAGLKFGKFGESTKFVKL